MHGPFGTSLAYFTQNTFDAALATPYRLHDTCCGRPSAGLADRARFSRATCSAARNKTEVEHMYSLIVATMMTTGTATPSWGWGCHGCHGCYGGCWGNAFSGYGCYGGGYGCYGGRYGCVGGCYGCYGCAGCYGCYGCYGGYSPYNPNVYMPRVVVGVSVAPVGVPQPMPVVVAKASDPSAPAPAQVTINIPSGARLLVNDIPVPVDPAARTFVTPALEPGRTYHYIFKVEMQTDGRLMREEQRVEVAAGKQVTVDFKGLTAAAARR
jgi:uncharacterized protein (TIGR03000 family)